MRSVLEMYKVGIGPSSSHTLGPMVACKRFFNLLKEKNLFDQVTRMEVDLYGSLSLTGRGHGTDKAIFSALAGEKADTVDTDNMPAFAADLAKNKKLRMDGSERVIDFDPATDLVFKDGAMPLHENGMEIKAFAGDKLLLERQYYSVGGGFIKEPEDFAAEKTVAADTAQVPYPFKSAKELLQHCADTGMPISSVIMQNEMAFRPKQEVIDYCKHVVDVMLECMKKGMHAPDGYLPGPDRVPCRAPALRRILNATSQAKTPLLALDWVNMFAMAVSEQNALGGRVVTAPTNGSCGVVPGVIAYYDKFVHPISDEEIWRFILSSGAIGLLYSMNGSISGAEVGCQGEVGVACSMAAAGLAELYSGSPQQVCAAAEIGMEHNLGLTCDAVRGMVQIPCIERNAMNAVKAINAAGMAMLRTSVPSVVSLDNVIEVMYKTGKDMKAIYRETSLGGLAIVKLDGHQFPMQHC